MIRIKVSKTDEKTLYHRELNLAGSSLDELKACQGDFIRCLRRVHSSEKGREEELSGRAVKLVAREFGLSSAKFLARLKPFDPFGDEDIYQPLPATGFEELTAYEYGEAVKRTFTNSIIQGAGHYIQGMYHLIEELNNGEKQVYKEIMKFGEQAIISVDRETSLSMQTKMPPAGLVRLEVTEKGDDARIIAYGDNLAVLLHELGKGAVEYLALDGRPDNTEVCKKVYALTDRRELEGEHLKSGILIWPGVLSLATPDNVSVSDPDFHLLRSLALKNLFNLPAEQFIAKVKQACAGLKIGIG